MKRRRDAPRKRGCCDLLVAGVSEDRSGEGQLQGEPTSQRTSILEDPGRVREAGHGQVSVVPADAEHLQERALGRGRLTSGCR